MPTSQISTSSPDAKLTRAKLSYFRQRLKNRIYQLILGEFRRQGISRSDLARRIGKRPEQITRWLGNPGNFTLDTISDLMIGMGGEPDMYFVAPGERVLPDQSQAPRRPPIPPIEGQNNDRADDNVVDFVMRLNKKRGASSGHSEIPPLRDWGRSVALS